MKGLVRIGGYNPKTKKLRRKRISKNPKSQIRKPAFKEGKGGLKRYLSSPSPSKVSPFQPPLPLFACRVKFERERVEREIEGD